MKTTSVFLVQLPEAVGAVAKQAASRAFSDLQFVQANTVADAAQNAVTGLQLMVLGDVPEADVSTAAQMTDAADLPRWAVVALGSASYDLVESVPIPNCQADLLERAFRASVMQHELMRENLKLQGDLKSVARRFSHDLRSPLNCAHITCELMKELSSTQSPSLLPQIEVMQNSLSETFEIIERFSTILKATAEPIPATVFSMDAVVSRVLEQLEDKIQQTGVTIKVSSDWPTVTGVAPWLETIWRNLLLNAMVHGLPAKPIQLGWSQTDDAWRFWVENLGAPIPPKIQNQLFRPFEQLHMRSSTGLGLTLVERLATLQGGRCGYERSGAETSLFYFTLPV